MKDLNIVLLNYLSRDNTIRAVESIIKDLNSCPFDVQITVADNSENKDGVKELIAEKFPQVDFIDCRGNIGFGAGCNLGFFNTKARYYCTLNSDIIILENSKTVERMIHFMDANPHVGIVGPKLLNLDGSLQYSCYRFDLWSILIKPFKQIGLDKKFKWAGKLADRLQMKEFDHNETMPVDWVMGSAMFVRKEATDQTGFFDDRYFMYMEDSDWCREMWEKNWLVYYVHDIILIHGHARDSAKVPGAFKALFKNKLARIHLKSWMQYLWKWKNNFKHYVA